MDKHNDQYDRLHNTWESHKANAKTGDHGEYIELDEGMISSAGLSFGDFESPGNFRTFSHPGDDTRTHYTVHSLGSGRFRINRGR
ncbi:hypothetical protein AB9P05_12870 [Roseivirga sp. BDSF3-8]|uniref:hypothetical protein n=1 Tax=Roseivirga sp. BDSF3-8 TaxID=3241598 RepID=UPI0035325D71